MRLFNLIFLFIAAPAFAYPSNTRYGYANCSSCHVSPTGGGILTPYGRMSASEFLSTWSYENEAEPLHGLAHKYLSPDDPIQVGGDSRYVMIHTVPDRNIWMQREGEVALTLTKELHVVASGGIYAIGPDRYRAETRRNYVLFTPNDHLSFRAGRFYPAYGIMVEDHTTATRSGLGWDQGHETYNLEAAYKSEYGEVFLTPMLGTENYAEMTPAQGYIARTDEKGATLRIAAYVGKGSQIGFSGLYSLLIDKDEPIGRYSYGPFAIVGITQDIYVLSEIDAAQTQGGKRQVYSYNLLGYEIWKGVHLQGQFQRRGPANEYAYKVQLFPRPHLEINASYNMTRYANTAILLVHYYL